MASEDLLEGPGSARMVAREDLAAFSLGRHRLPRGPKVVPFYGLIFRILQVISKRNPKSFLFMGLYLEFTR